MIPKLSLPLQLLLVLGIVITLGNSFPLSIIEFLYAISLTFKECLGFLLPFLVFAFISTGILAFKKNAPFVIALLLTTVLISNSIIAFFSFFVCKALLPYITNNVVIEQITTNIVVQPLWSFHLPKLLNSEHAMIGAIISGLLLSYITIPGAEIALTRFRNSIQMIMNSIFIPILPIYVLGFLLEIHYKGVFLQLFQSFSKTFVLMILLHVIAIFLIYFVASYFNLNKTIFYIKNAMPSYMTAFGTMSSTATIPVTINCSNKNINNSALVNIATPILANIHLLGDAISTPILALTTLYLFTGNIPSIMSFSLFIAYFCITMLAVSGVPGGGIIVMIPILTKILGFSDAMISVITTLYLLQDSFGTAANVMGDGALTIILNNLLNKLGIK